MVLALSALVVACADAHPLAPSGPVVGRWGGVDADLVSLAQSVRLRLPCGTIDFASPIAPAATGVFTVQSLGRGGTDTRPLAPAILQGRVTGAAMQITVTYLLPATQRTATYELSRDRAPVFETVCPP